MSRQLKIGDLVKSPQGNFGTVVAVDPPSKRRLRIAQVHFSNPDPGQFSGVDGYPEGFLEVVNESR